jgi:lysophospholipase L1-like esterase
MKHGFTIASLTAALTLTACLDAQTPTPKAIALASGSVSWSGLIPPATAHVDARLKILETSPTIKEGVLFLGDSITEGAPLFSMFPNLVTSNHGIGWDTTEGVLLRLNQVTRNSPERLFLMIGTNDTNYTDDAVRISENIFEIVDRLDGKLPNTDIYVVSVLPREARGNAILAGVNNALLQNTGGHNYIYLDLASAMRSPSGEMKSELSYDNLHLNVHGYALWEETLRGCVWSGCPEGF